MDEVKVSAPGLDQRWDLPLSLLSPWTHGCPSHPAWLSSYTTPSCRQQTHV